MMSWPCVSGHDKGVKCNSMVVGTQWKQWKRWHVTRWYVDDNVELRSQELARHTEPLFVLVKQ
jgi:hypothetical protein